MTEIYFRNYFTNFTVMIAPETALFQGMFDTMMIPIHHQFYTKEIAYKSVIIIFL